MQREFLDLLSEPVRQFVQEVEQQSGLYINVQRDPDLDDQGPEACGALSVNIEVHRVVLYAPMRRYFPDGAVRHEMLHVHRFHVQGVPMLAMDDRVFSRAFAERLTAIDNAIEHLAIVPLELGFHPDRRAHWETMVGETWTAARSNPPEAQCLAACLHWTFLRHVLPDSQHAQLAVDFMKEQGLYDTADGFADQFLALIARKDDQVRFLLAKFPELNQCQPVLKFLKRPARLG